MTVHPATSPATADRPVARLLRTAWAAPLLVFGVARAVSALLLTLAARVQPDLTAHPGWHVEGTRPAAPSYWEILSNWDGQWFKTVALHGYAGVDPGQGIEQNALAFSPLYPALVRGVMATTGLGFEMAASLVSLAAAATAMVLLHRWLVATRGRGPALAAVAVLSFFPAAPVLQSAYSDALALLLLVLALRAAVERRWVALFLAGAALAFTRPVLLPVAAFVVLVDWRQNLAAGRRLALDARGVGAAAGLTALAFAWPVTAGVIAGSSDAYFTSNAAWRMDGRALGGWLTGLWAAGMGLVAVLMALILATLLALRWRRRHEATTPDLLGSWAALYLLFMLLTAPPSAGIVRHTLLTLVPLGVVGPMAPALTPRRRAALVGVVVVVELALQWLWVRYVFVVEDPGGARIP